MMKPQTKTFGYIYHDQFGGPGPMTYRPEKPPRYAVKSVRSLHSKTKRSLQFIEEAAKNAAVAPGPGAYNLRTSDPPAGGSVKASGRSGPFSIFDRVEKRAKFGPAPNKYDTRNDLLRHSQSVPICRYESETLATSKALLHSGKDAGPGPGAYNIPDPEPVSHCKASLAGRHFNFDMPNPFNYILDEGFERRFMQNYTGQARKLSHQFSDGDHSSQAQCFHKESSHQYSDGQIDPPEQPETEETDKSNDPDAHFEEGFDLLAGMQAPANIPPPQVSAWQDAEEVCDRPWRYRSRYREAAAQSFEEKQHPRHTLALPLYTRQERLGIANRMDLNKSQVTQGKLRLYGNALSNSLKSVLPPLDTDQLKKDSLKALRQKAVMRCRVQGMPKSDIHKILKEIPMLFPDLSRYPDLQDFGEDAAHAATRIQARYRGKVARRQVSHHHEEEKHLFNQLNIGSSEWDGDQLHAACKIQATYRGKQTRRQMARQNADDRYDDEQERIRREQEEATLKIQSQFRGKQARQQVVQHREESSAALKIQSRMRGKQARREVEMLRSGTGEGTGTKQSVSFQGTELAMDSSAGGGTSPLGTMSKSDEAMLDGSKATSAEQAVEGASKSSSGQQQVVSSSDSPPPLQTPDLSLSTMKTAEETIANVAGAPSTMDQTATPAGADSTTAGNVLGQSLDQTVGNVMDPSSDLDDTHPNRNNGMDSTMANHMDGADDPDATLGNVKANTNAQQQVDSSTRPNVQFVDDVDVDGSATRPNVAASGGLDGDTTQPNVSPEVNPGDSTLNVLLETNEATDGLTTTNPNVQGAMDSTLANILGSSGGATPPMDGAEVSFGNNNNAAFKTYGSTAPLDQIVEDGEADADEPD